MTAVIVLCFIGTLEYRSRCEAKTRLDKLTPAHDAATTQAAQLAQQQNELARHREEAELFTYLGARWPRTRLLRELIDPLPEQVLLNSVRIEQVSPEGKPNRSRLARASQEAEQQLAVLSPAARDLARLRNEREGTRTMILVVGVAEDAGTLYRYLADLGEQPLFTRVELEQTQRVEGKDQHAMEFSVQINVRPGYGEPGGPVGGPLAEQSTAGVLDATDDQPTTDTLPAGLVGLSAPLRDD